MCIFQVIHHRLKTRDRLKALKLLRKIWYTNSMMKDSVSTIVIGIRSSNYTDHRQIFTVSSGDGVKDTESTNGESNHTRANAFSTCVTVGSITGVKFVTAADEVKLRLSDQVIKKSQIEVAGNGEDITDADLD
jgi:hypothetical protein